MSRDELPVESDWVAGGSRHAHFWIELIPGSRSAPWQQLQDINVASQIMSPSAVHAVVALS